MIFPAVKSVSIVPLLNSVCDFIGINAYSFDQEVKKIIKPVSNKDTGRNFITL